MTLLRRLRNTTEDNILIIEQEFDLIQVDNKF